MKNAAILLLKQTLTVLLTGMTTFLFAQPVNDNCPNAILLTSSTACTFTNGTTANATLSLGDCISGGNGSDDDVWYRFVASNTTHTVTVTSAVLNMVLNLRTSIGGCPGTLVDCINNTGAGGTESYEWSGLTIGSTYYIRLYTLGTSSSGGFSICLTHPAPPANDNCSGAIDLTPGASCVNTSGTTVAATNSIPACGGFGTADHDVWYKFTATALGHRITASSATLDLVLNPRSGACNGGGLGCFNATGVGGTETVDLTGLTIGTSYFVRVYTIENGTGGSFNICVTSLPAPANNECSGATQLNSSNSCSTTTGTTVGATQSTPACNGFGSADDDVWYKFTAQNYTHTVTVASTSLDMVVEALSGNCPGASLTCTNATGDGGTETVTLNGLTLGATYFLRVYSVENNAQGTFTICVTHPNTISNDECSGAILLTSAVACVPTSGITNGATQSLPACASGYNADDDVWYKFVATHTQHTVQVSKQNSQLPVPGTGFVSLDVRSGSCNGTSIACQNGPFLSFPDLVNTQTASLSNLTIGATYYARVYSQYNDFISFTICVTHPPPPANDECAGAITLTPSSSTCSLSNSNTNNATQSLPACGTGSADDDVWFKFNATTTSHVVKVFSADFDMTFDVRTGACNGTSIACVNATGVGGTESTLLTGLTVGATYYIRVYSQEVGTGGNGFDICIGPPAPANDNCSGAILLSSALTCTTTAGDTRGATQSLPDCSGGNTTDDDVWYQFVAVASTHTVTVSSALNIAVNVRGGVCGATDLGCSTSGGTGVTETLTLTNLTPGATYYARVFTQSTTTFGTFTICVTHITAPANDNCAGAILLTPSESCVTTSGTTVGASQSLPDCSGGNNSDDDVWYRFVATSTRHSITAFSATLNMIVEVRSVSCDGVSITCASTAGQGAPEIVNLNNLTIGVTYYVRVFSQSSSTTGEFTICVTTLPTNDDCADAILLTSSVNCMPVSGNTAGATQTLGNCAVTTANDLWYQFVAVSPTHTITVSSNTLNLIINVRGFTGSCPGNGAGCVDNAGPGGTETTTLSNLIIGATYYVRVFNADPLINGAFTICVTHPPANDDCSGAISLTSGTSCVNTTGSTVSATQSQAACATTTANDVWYQFVAVSPNHTITVSSATMDIVFNVRIGSCSGSGFGCVNSTGIGGTETVTYTSLVVGNTYYIRLFSDNPAITGNFTICVTHIPIPANDDCAGAVLLTPGAGCTPTTGITSAATQSLPDCNGGADSDDDVWYRFVATSASHTITVAPIGPIFDLAMDIRTGLCNGSTLICQNNTGGGVAETNTLTSLTIGTTYYIRVFGVNGRGDFNICVATPPANDECSGAMLLTSGTTCTNTSGSTISATQSLAACGAGSADDDVWYRFVAVYPVQTVTVSSATLNMALNVRTGACPGAELACINATGAGGTETTTLTGLSVGATYYIRVYGTETGTTGTFNICVTHPAPPANNDCANAVTLTSSPACSTTSGTTSGATESVAACAGTGAADDDVWYKFTAVSPSHTVTVNSAVFDAVINVRTGACNGTDLNCSNNVSGTGTETAAVTGLTIGNTYLIRVYSSEASAVGTFTICVTHQLPANDECNGAVDLTPTAGTFTDPGMQSNEVATQTAPGANCLGSFIASSIVQDVWYRFTTNSSGGTVNIAASPANGTGNPVVHFFAGCNTGPISCNDQGGPGATETLSIPGLPAGSTFYFRVYGQNTPAFPFTVALSGNALNNALPLELASFTGRTDAQSNILTWTTLSEKNVQFHIVERAVTGTDWAEIGRSDGQMDSQMPLNYSFEDPTPPARAFYRLRSVDYDGAESLSASIVLTRENEAFGVLNLFPSPARDQLTVQFNLPKEEPITLYVSNSAGRQVLKQYIEAVSGLNEWQLALQDLPAGMYVLQLRSARQNAVPQRFVKE